jgi:hypothetical protein
MYSFWTPHAVSYLTMYQRAVAHLLKTGIHLRFGVVDAYEEQNSKFPYLLLTLDFSFFCKS